MSKWSASCRCVPAVAGLAGRPRGAGLLAAALLLTGCSSRVAPPPPAAPAPAPALETRVEPQSEWAEAIVYFAIVDRFADGDPSNNDRVDRSAKGAFHGGDLAGLRQRLDDLAELGITALWITPVVRNIDGFVTGAGFPDWGYHGYWADDFYSLDPRFGTEQELADLVDAAHRRGIKVLLDVVYNHVGYGSRYLTDPETRGWLRSEEAGTCGGDDITSCLAGLPDLKTELPQVADYLLEAHLGLAERVGLDGFRLDTVKHVTHEFWREHRRRVDERLGEEFFLLGEVWGGDAQVLDPWFSGDELDAGFDFGFQGSAVAFVQGRGRSVAFNRYLEKRHEVRDGHHLAHYLSSHDTPGALFQLHGDLDRFRLAAFLQLTVAGIPVIYYGEEVGRLGGDWPENRSDMPWGDLEVLPGAGLPRDDTLREIYQRLIELRRRHPAVWRGGHRGLQFEDDLFLFERRDEASGEVVVVAVNRAEEPGRAVLEVPDAWAGRTVRDAWSGEAIAIVEGGAEIEVPPLWGRLLVAE